MATLWIDNNLVIRHSEKGWPVEPQMSFGDYNPEEQKIYLDELAQAKAKSIMFDQVDFVKAITRTTTTTPEEAEQVIRFNYKPDTFIEISGEVEVVEIPCESVYDDFKCVICGAEPFSDGHTRKVARLKPASSAMSFTEAMDYSQMTPKEIADSISDRLIDKVKQQFEKNDNLIDHDGNPVVSNIRARILEEFEKIWLGAHRRLDTDISMRTCCQAHDILKQTLDELNIK